MPYVCLNTKISIKVPKSSVPPWFVHLAIPAPTASKTQCSLFFAEIVIKNHH